MHWGEEGGLVEGIFVLDPSATYCVSEDFP